MHAMTTKPMTLSSATGNALGSLLEKLAEEHIRAAKNWVFWDQRRDYIEEVVTNYWSDPLLVVLFPTLVNKTMTELNKMLTTARSMINASVATQKTR